MSKALTEKQKHIIRKNYKKMTVDQLSRQLKRNPDEIEAYIASLDLKISPKRRALFTAILIAIPILFFIVLELLLMVFNYGGNLDLFIPTSEDVGPYYKCNHEVGNRYFFMQVTVPDPSKDLFLREKPENGFRIFVLGGSTTAGFPFGNNITFPSILHRMLQDRYPQKQIEVVNLGMSAICSYTLLDFMDEIVQYEPDAILMYAGHNEFYGALGVASTESLGKNPGVIHAYLHLRKFRTFLLIRDIVGYFKKAANRSEYGNNSPDPTATLMERIVSEQTIPYKSDLYNQGIHQFRTNLNLILKKAKEKKIPFILSELVSNIKDQPPFISKSIGDFQPADEVYREARKKERSGQFNYARELYTKAKDLDALRFRASEECNDIIHELAGQYQFPVVSMKQAFEEASPRGLVGGNLMTDHLHPNIDGYFLMADAFLESIVKAHIINAENVNPSAKSLNRYKAEWGMTALDSVYAELSLGYLKGGWPFQPKGTINTFLKTYHPVTVVDSIALAALVTKDISLETAHLKLARKYENNGQMDLALREFKALYYAIPYEPLFFNGAAGILMQKKKYDSAQTLLEKSYHIHPNAFASKWLGMIFMSKKEFPKAISFLEAACRLNPRDAETFYKLGQAYASTARLKEATEILGIMQQRFPGSPKIEQLKRYIAGISKFTTNELKKLFTEAQNHLKNKEYSQAQPLLEKSLKLKETEYARIWLARICLLQKDIAGGITHLEKAAELSPDNGNILYNLANAYMMNGDKKSASAVIKKLETLNPDFDDPAGLKEKLK